MKPLVTSVLLTLAAALPAAGQTGVLLLAHGGQPQWNDRVVAVVNRVNETSPTEVAFGMASRATIQAAVDRLTARGVKDIAAHDVTVGRA